MPAKKKKSVPTKKTAAKKTPVKKPAPKKAAPAKVKTKPVPKKKPVAKAAPKKKTQVKKAKPAAKKPAPAKTKVKKAPVKAKTAPAKAKAKPAVKAKPKAKTAPKKAKTSGGVRISSAPPPPTANLPKSVDELLGRPSIRQLAKRSAKLKPLTKKELDTYRKLLLELRDRVIDEIGFLANDNLNRSSKESSGDLSSYSLHMADQGTDNFDREFAASLLNTEYDVLYEIDEAIRRIDQGTYGVCEVSGEQIERERLKVLPFARCSVAVQSEIEKKKPRHQPFRRVGLQQSADFSSSN